MTTACVSISQGCNASPLSIRYLMMLAMAFAHPHVKHAGSAHVLPNQSWCAHSYWHPLSTASAMRCLWSNMLTTHLYMLCPATPLREIIPFQLTLQPGLCTLLLVLPGSSGHIRCTISTYLRLGGGFQCRGWLQGHKWPNAMAVCSSCLTRVLSHGHIRREPPIHCGVYLGS